MIEIVWFKRDLRVDDNIVLSMASQSGTILPLYIFEPHLWKQPDLSYRHYRFLLEALDDLDKQLRYLGASLTILVGDAVVIFDGTKS